VISLACSDARRIPLADQSVHCVITSPPYFGLRDYGTATWQGGDPACDHKVPPSRKGNYPESNRKQQTNSGSLTYREWTICGKCDAVRMDAQIGLEASPDCLGWARGENCGKCYICHLRPCAAEVWRVLRDDGTFWLNLGSSYASANTVMFKPKDLIPIPWLAALALQADGW